MNAGILEFVFTIGHIEVYKEKEHEAYYWKYFDEDKFHGAFMSLHTCMSNYENNVMSQAGMIEALASSSEELASQKFAGQQQQICPVVQSTNLNNNLILVDFFKKKRAF